MNLYGVIKTAAHSVTIVITAARRRLVTGVDVIGLLETDAAKPYVDSHDIASWLSEELGMYVDYGPGPKDHTWG